MITILHFSPLELYPPIQNLLNELGAQAGTKVLVCTTHSSKTSLKTFSPIGKNIKIHRFGRPGGSVFSRYLSYLFFTLGSILVILGSKTRRLLYFETLSAFPAYICRNILKLPVEVLIHYHEYTSPREFASGMKLTKIWHNLEKKLYPIASWVSHTNEQRLQKFIKDVEPVIVKCPFVLPNYPPSSWLKSVADKPTLPLKIVYAGALSLNTMFTREFASWVIRQNGDVIWHIYSYNFTNDAKEYIENLSSKFIKLLPGVDYENLPQILNQYHVGVILYKGHIDNYVFNAPNKLFEYLACGLSVWFPQNMIGSLPYQTFGRSFPEVVALDFQNLNMDPKDVVKNYDHPITPSPYTCDEALKPLLKKLL
jgi:hypothetical protein